MSRRLKQSVVVITGASSGIGRAAALTFAGKGASVVVSARDGAALRDVVSEIEQRGGRGLAIPTDVTDQDAVKSLASRAVETFGRIDIWISSAGVLLLGRIADTPADEFRRVIDTNFFGPVHGARAVLPIFRAQGFGTLINVASLDSWVPQPHAAAYVASKHAVRSLGMSLRQDLLLEDADDIHVVTILLATIDTPIFQHTANYTGHQVKAPPPVYPADDVVKAILQAVKDPQPEVYAGTAAKPASLFMKLMPGATERIATRMVRMQEVDGTQTAPTAGNLFEPGGDDRRIEGGWRGSSPARGTVGKMVGWAAVAVPAVVIGRRAWQQRG